MERSGLPLSRAASQGRSLYLAFPALLTEFASTDGDLGAQHLVKRDTYSSGGDLARDAADTAPNTLRLYAKLNTAATARPR